MVGKRKGGERAPFDRVSLDQDYCNLYLWSSCYNRPCQTRCPGVRDRTLVACPHLKQLYSYS